MSVRNPIKRIKLYKEAVERIGRDGLSMRLRLFAWLLLFLNAVMIGVIVLLLTTGTFESEVKEHKSTIENELSHISQDIYRQYGEISVQAVSLSDTLSAHIERAMSDSGNSPHEIKEHPELLEGLLSQELSVLVGALEKAKSSGVFLILDATVNPSLPDWENSKACIYLKNMEPNIVSGLDSNLRYMAGPMSIARENGIYIIPQWTMELNIEAAPYFSEVVDTAKTSNLQKSRLYFWTPSFTMNGNSEKIMMCCVPLIASDKTVMGICGFEISEMLFKLSYAPNNEEYDYVFAVLAPIENGALDVESSLLAGSYAAYPSQLMLEPLFINEKEKYFTKYRQKSGAAYAGTHRKISLYPKDSAYQDRSWAVAVMMPDSILLDEISSHNRVLIIGIACLMVIDIALSLLISRRYIKPVTRALEQLKNADISQAQKTKIPEIDDLIEFLSAKDEAAEKPDTKNVPLWQERSVMYREFVNNIEKLSAAERVVFDLYMEGHTAKEIADILCLSINTIKTHNRRIYMKLNVTSRKELMVYIQMMEEASDVRVKDKIQE